MPNWTINRLVVKFNDEEAEADFMKLANDIVGDAEEEDSLLMHFIPRPADENANWYEWNCDNWGTKWNERVLEVHKERGAVVVDMETAWSPPIPLVEAIAKGETVDSALMLYCEAGCDFMGYYSVSRNGARGDSTFSLHDSVADYEEAMGLGPVPESDDYEAEYERIMEARNAALADLTDWDMGDLGLGG